MPHAIDRTPDRDVRSDIATGLLRRVPHRSLSAGLVEYKEGVADRDRANAVLRPGVRIHGVPHATASGASRGHVDPG